VDLVGVTTIFMAILAHAHTCEVGGRTLDESNEQNLFLKRIDNKNFASLLVGTLPVCSWLPHVGVFGGGARRRASELAQCFGVRSRARKHTLEAITR
jgi:hypothetical protein